METWQEIEKIVTKLEQFLSNDAKVEHNKFLPVIGKPNRDPRQCDIVITFSNGARKSVTIVEVQSRKSKLDINTFHGWVKKMEEVGAQQLICVSEIGFPESIIDEVKNTYGENKITLMTLKEFDYVTEPKQFNMLSTMIQTKREIEIESIKNAVIVVPDSQKENFDLNFILTDNIFSQENEQELISLFDIVCKNIPLNYENQFLTMDENQNKIFSYNFKIEKEMNYKILLNNSFFLVKNLEMIVLIKHIEESKPIEVTQFEYRPELTDNFIAWISKFKFDKEGKTQQGKIIFKGIKNN